MRDHGSWCGPRPGCIRSSSSVLPPVLFSVAPWPSPRTCILPWACKALSRYSAQFCPFLCCRTPGCCTGNLEPPHTPPGWVECGGGRRPLCSPPQQPDPPCYLVLPHRVHDPQANLPTPWLDLIGHFAEPLFNRPTQREFFRPALVRTFGGDIYCFCSTHSHRLVLLFWLCFYQPNLALGRWRTSPISTVFRHHLREEILFYGTRDECLRLASVSTDTRTAPAIGCRFAGSINRGS